MYIEIFSGRRVNKGDEEMMLRFCSMEREYI